MKMDFEKSVENILKYELIKKGDEVLCALSGGPDSIYLLYSLLEVRKELSFNLKVASVNHGLREEAKEEMDFCEKLAKNLKLEFYKTTIPMIEFSEIEKISLEDAGRRLRYRFFYSLIGEKGKIALGHHLNDQAETIFMNLLRGTGLRGLSGMSFQNGQRIRPLLNITKEEILETLHKLEIPYFLDHTNLENDHKRNEIRNVLLPEIEKNYNPRFQESLVRLGDLAREDQEALEVWAGKKKKEIIKNQIIFKKPFLKEPVSIQRRILLQIFEKYKNLKDLSFQQIEELRSLFHKKLSKEIILKDIRFISTYEGVKFLLKEDESQEEIPFKLGKITFGNWQIESSLISHEIFNKIEKRDRFFYDASILENPLVLRKRKDGERFQPFGFSGTKSLRNFFIDEKIPQYKRDHIPLLVNSEKILAVGSYRRGDGFEIQKETENILMIEMREKDEIL